jgi:hypothetical protein
MVHRLPRSSVGHDQADSPLDRTCDLTDGRKALPARVAERPRPELWAAHELLTFAEAAALFWPDRRRRYRRPLVHFARRARATDGATCHHAAAPPRVHAPGAEFFDVFGIDTVRHTDGDLMKKMGVRTVADLVKKAEVLRRVGKQSRAGA